MVLNDAGVIGYSLNGKSFPATAPVAVVPFAPQAADTHVVVPASVRPDDSGTRGFYVGLGLTDSTGNQPFWNSAGNEERRRPD